MIEREIIKERQNDTDDEVIYYSNSPYSKLAQFVWFIYGLVTAFLVARFILRLMGANSAAAFTDFIYNTTSPLVQPFSNVLSNSAFTTGTIEWAAIIALVIYYLFAWAIVRLFSLATPVTR